MTPKELREKGLNIICSDEPTEEQLTEAKDLLFEAFKQNDAPAAAILASLEYENDGNEEFIATMLKVAFLLWEESDKDEDGKPYIAMGHYIMGDIYYDREEDSQIVFNEYMLAYEMGVTKALANIGALYADGDVTPNGEPDMEKARYYWEIGIEEGIDSCKQLYNKFCLPDNDSSTDETDNGENDDNEPETNDDQASPEAKTRDKSEQDKYVIIVTTNNEFIITQADASDWRSLPELIDAERTDDLRCEKFNNVSRKLQLKGNLVGQLDRNAFQKPDLEPNYFASQCYNAMTDLYGDMIICMEDRSYNPFSFASQEEAQRVIDALRNR